jgi:hypothetical protein
MVVIETKIPQFDAPNADEIPGVRIGSGTHRGVVDAIVDPNDIYAISLTAGKQVRITIKGEEQGGKNDKTSYWEGVINVLSPKSTTISEKELHDIVGSSDFYFGRYTVINHLYKNETTLTYTPATSDTYYLWVQSTKGNIPYEIELTGVVDPIPFLGQTYLILGIIVILFGIILLLVKKKKPVIANLQNSTSRTKNIPPPFPKRGRFCSECGNPMDSSERFCSECGAKRE